MSLTSTAAQTSLGSLRLPSLAALLAHFSVSWFATAAFAQTDEEVAINLTEFYTNNYTYTDSQVYTWPTATPASQGLSASQLASADNRLNQLDNQSNDAASLLVVRGGKLVHETYFHGTQPDDANNIHSASKSILSALTGIAIDEGLLALDTKIGDVLPQSMSSSVQNITVQNLLTMKSGLDWNEDNTEYDLDDNYVQEILDLGLDHSPGTHYNYSTGDAHLMGAVLAEASGMSVHQYGKSRLFDPLGIDVEKWGRDEQGYFSGGCNFYITPREMAAFGQLYLDGGHGIVPEEWIEESTDVQVPQVHPGYDYGYFWWTNENLDGYEGYRAWGWGKQFIYVFPSLDMVVVMTHDTQGNVDDDDRNNFVENYVISAVTGAAVLPVDGDYDGNGYVDDADYAMWRQAFGDAVSPWGSGADGNWDGVVDAIDYALWRDNFGNGTPPGAGAGSATIPEPATASLALWLLALLVWKPGGMSRRPSG